MPHNLASFRAFALGTVSTRVLAIYALQPFFRRAIDVVNPFPIDLKKRPHAA